MWGLKGTEDPRVAAQAQEAGSLSLGGVGRVLLRLRGLEPSEGFALSPEQWSSLELAPPAGESGEDVAGDGGEESGSGHGADRGRDGVEWT